MIIVKNRGINGGFSKLGTPKTVGLFLENTRNGYWMIWGTSYFEKPPTVKKNGWLIKQQIFLRDGLETPNITNLAYTILYALANYTTILDHQPSFTITKHDETSYAIMIPDSPF